MDFKNYHTIAGYLSSSELNRCNKNGLLWYESKSIKEWHDIFKSEWLPRKLRRKLRTLYHFNILPVKIATFVTPEFSEDELTLFKEMWNELSKSMLNKEDVILMKGSSI